ncbi:hypothetical protein PTW35_24620 (plasmid) [Photobacterium sp. DA100]|uniref:hypothetical protein n=1 Tax=Photobacterium sp. DA100 TaxID=3027472 RepID=UPI0024790CA2|nr:hypothetical protein [Photobacterium sp. DA100]WEM44460.1 hypothetical protein PTW35_24620 [Photobacterium sp. DA100]
MNKILFLITGLLTFTCPVIADDFMTIDASENPLFQAIIEPVRVGHGHEQRSTFVINMEDSATFKLGDDGADNSTIFVTRSDIPDKDYTVFLDTSVIFANDETMGFNRSVQKLSTRLPLSDGERIRIGGNRMITEQDGVTSEVVTEVWFTLNKSG